MPPLVDGESNRQCQLKRRGRLRGGGGSVVGTSEKEVDADCEAHLLMGQRLNVSILAVFTAIALVVIIGRARIPTKHKPVNVL